MPRSTETTGGAGREQQRDAIDLLETDHRMVEQWFEQFEDTDSDEQKEELAADICLTLRVHTQIEEEIFYPACRAAGVDENDLDEAKVEHDSATRLIQEIEASGPDDELWESKVTVLAEMIEHHVEEEEEEEDGVFAQARSAGLDLVRLGQRMQARKDELTEQLQRG